MSEECKPFSFHKIHGSRIKLTNSNCTATRVEAVKFYDNGVVYTGIPFSGHSRFVVEANELGVGWSGSFKLGVVLLSPDTFKQGFQPPRYSPGSARNSWVWSSNSLHIGSDVKVSYGTINLEELEKGDKLGIEILSNGTLKYSVNGVDQGAATSEIYNTNKHVYGFVDHYGQAVTSTIVEAFVNPFSLQYLCRQVIFRNFTHEINILSQHLPRPLLWYLADVFTEKKAETAPRTA